MRQHISETKLRLDTFNKDSKKGKNLRAKVADFQNSEILCIQETWNHTGQKELKIPETPTQQPTADPKASMVAG